MWKRLKSKYFGNVRATFWNTWLNWLVIKLDLGIMAIMILMKIGKYSMKTNIPRAVNISDRQTDNQTGANQCQNATMTSCMIYLYRY